jgi:hypothetical protein
MIESQIPAIEPKHKPVFWIVGAIIVVGLLWGLSLALPVWNTRDDHSGDWYAAIGLIPAFIGFLGIFVLCPAWYANLLLIPSCVLLFKGRRWGFLLSLVALALAASAYTMPGIYGDNSEGVIEGRRIGFYLWLGSFVTLALAHALLTPVANRGWIPARVALVAFMVLCIGGLEKICPVGVSPLETSLKDPKDVVSLTAALAHHPSQTDKDAALWWAMQQNLEDDRSAPSKQVIMLLDAGANPNEPERSGTSLLIQALPPYGSEALVKLLVKAGADVNAHNWQGTVLDDAITNGCTPQLQEFLINAGARSSSH